MIIFILNVLWFVLGGFIAALGWFLAGIIMAITIIGLPWARSCFVIGRYTLWPFGHELVSRNLVSGPDLGTGALGTIGNIIWFVLAGWWLALGNLSMAVAYAVTIIGLPFAWAYFKLAMASLFPVGKTVIDTDKIDILPGAQITVKN